LKLTDPQKEEKRVERKDVRQTAVKVGRRLSSRVGELFKPKKVESATPAKVDENPPKIDEPAPVAPLENPATATGGDAPEATSAAPAPAPAPAPAEEPKAEVPPAAPVVAAAA
jgi:hypothetical protein